MAGNTKLDVFPTRVKPDLLGYMVLCFLINVLSKSLAPEQLVILMIA